MAALYIFSLFFAFFLLLERAALRGKYRKREGEKYYDNRRTSMEKK